MALPPESQRVVEVGSRIVAALPLLCAAVIFAAAIYIRLSFGRWPVVYRDSVETTYAELAVAGTALAFFGLVLLPILALATVLARWLTGLRPLLGRWFVVFTVSWLTVLAYLRWDPQGFVAWLID